MSSEWSTAERAISHVLESFPSLFTLGRKGNPTLKIEPIEEHSPSTPTHLLYNRRVFQSNSEGVAHVDPHRQCSHYRLNDASPSNREANTSCLITDTATSDSKTTSTRLRGIRSPRKSTFTGAPT